MRYDDMVKSTSVEVTYPGCDMIEAEVRDRMRLDDHCAVALWCDGQLDLLMSRDGVAWHAPNGDVVEVEELGESTRRAIAATPYEETGAIYSLSAEHLRKQLRGLWHEEMVWLITIMSRGLTPAKPFIEEQELRARLNLAKALQEVTMESLRNDVDPWRVFCFYKPKMLELGVLVVK